MAIGYLQNLSWDRISREERFFCCELFNDLRKNQNCKDFIAFLNSTPSPAPGFKNDIRLNPSKKWEVGFEVCFYRDMLYVHEKPIKPLNYDRKQKGKLVFPQKRTFDLCLFSNDDIVIIEAKSQQGLNSNQCMQFHNDKAFIGELFKEIGFPCPEIHLVVLASSGFYQSKSFTLDNGIGKKMLVNNKSTVSGFIAWSQIKELLGSPIYEQADRTYKN